MASEEIRKNARARSGTYVAVATVALAVTAVGAPGPLGLVIAAAAAAFTLWLNIKPIMATTLILAAWVKRLGAAPLVLIAAGAVAMTPAAVPSMGSASWASVAALLCAPMVTCYCPLYGMGQLSSEMTKEHVGRAERTLVALISFCAPQLLIGAACGAPLDFMYVVGLASASIMAWPIVRIMGPAALFCSMTLAALAHVATGPIQPDGVLALIGVSLVLAVPTYRFMAKVRSGGTGGPRGE